MSPTNHDRMMEILGEALELAPEQRDVFLAGACANDAALRAHLDRLLGRAGEAVAAIPTHHPEVAARAFAPPTRIGAYRIIRELGSGGMGAVYLGMQQSPVRRPVAIKLLLPGMDSRSVLARFESERQALAMMDHPNVAIFFDAGVTELGRPYFAMQYVDGVPITKYADEHRLTTRQRVALFIHVCDAVHHAHQKAIIHRDLKPTNVLVTERNGKPHPVVIDFGIAKATDQRLTDRTLQTEHGQLVGTPEYMSPEQAAMGADIDTRSDVYSLGVMLYELLAGALPFDSKTLRESEFDELRRIIREVEPPRPSTRVGAVGGSEARRRELRGEIDWIVMRAIEKERDRRYSSAAELAADLNRYLRDEPVEAGPPSGFYRARKLVRRHRRLVIAACLIVVTLIAGIVATAWQARIAIRERQTAQNRAADIRKLAGTLIFDIDEAIQNAGPTRAREQLVETGRRYLDQLAAESGDDATLQDLVGGYLRLGIVQYYPGFSHLGRPSDAAESYGKALALAQKRAETNPSNTRAQGDVGRAYIYLSRANSGLRKLDLALEQLASARAIFESLAKIEPNVPTWSRNVGMTLDLAGDVYRELGDGTRALEATQQCREIYERLAAAHPDDRMLQRDVMVVRSGLAVLLMNTGLPGEAIEHVRHARAIASELLRLEPQNLQYARDVHNETNLLCETMLQAGYASEPAQLAPQLVEQSRAELKEDPSDYRARRDLATALKVLGESQHAVGEFDRAIEALREGMALEDALLQIDPSDRFILNQAANTHRALALVLLDAGRWDEAHDHAEQAVARHRAMHAQSGADGLSVCNSLRVLAEVQLAQDVGESAIVNLREAATFYAVPQGQPLPPAPDRREYIYVLGALGEALRRSGDADTALATLAEGKSIADELLRQSPDDRTIAWWRARIQLSRARIAQERLDRTTAIQACSEAEADCRALVERDESARAYRAALAEAMALRESSTEPSTEK